MSSITPSATLTEEGTRLRDLSNQFVNFTLTFTELTLKVPQTPLHMNATSNVQVEKMNDSSDTRAIAAALNTLVESGILDRGTLLSILGGPRDAKEEANA